MTLQLVRIGDYTFPHNPRTSMGKLERKYVRHAYPGTTYEEYEDLGLGKRQITLTGEFFGETYLTDYHKLETFFSLGGVSTFYHPIHFNVQHVCCLSLDASVSNTGQEVVYTLVLGEHRQIQALTEITASEPAIDPEDAAIRQLGTLRNGDTGSAVVELQNALINNGFTLPLFGADGIFGSETENAVRQYQSANSLSIDGIAGPITLTALGVEYYGGAGRNGEEKQTYIVRSGDTLVRIASKFDLTWQQIAEINNIADPRALQVGSTLVVEI